jgi:hypothetical protein
MLKREAREAAAANQHTNTSNYQPNFNRPRQYNINTVGPNIWTGRYVVISTSLGIYLGLAALQ